jgi:site-specific recombinase XerD
VRFWKSFFSLVFKKWGAGGSAMDNLFGFERHLRVLQALSEKSIFSYRRTVEDFLKWSADKNLTELTRKDIEAYLEACYYRGNSNQTRLTKLIALQKFFRFLKYEDILDNDITAGIPSPKVWKKFAQRFTTAEVLKLFGAIDLSTSKGMRDVSIFILAVFCGLRIGEICRLTMNDVIDDGQTVYFNVVDTKFHSSRSVSLWKAPSMFIRQWFSTRISQGAKTSDPFLISFTRRRCLCLTSSGISQIIKHYADKAGLRKIAIRAHMFRATHYDDLRHIKGFDIQAIAGRLGWKHTSTADRYISNRDRVSPIYASLAAYWHEFPGIWKRRDNEAVEKKD